MKLFSGFPDGKIKVTPLPNLFFSELLPEIDDLAELKVTLHVFWVLANSKSRYVRESDLRADQVLVRSLKTIDTKNDALAHGLDLAVKRGTLLGLKTDQTILYFANSRQGRDALDKMRTNELELELPREPAQTTERPNIFLLYEQNIGLLTPIVADDLKEAEELYSAEWIADAIKEAVENNKRNWRYARKILQRWKEEGRIEKPKKKTWYDEYGKFIKR
jgi:DnaD/phage-associated family protein